MSVLPFAPNGQCINPGAVNSLLAELGRWFTGATKMNTGGISVGATGSTLIIPKNPNSPPTTLARVFLIPTGNDAYMGGVPQVQNAINNAGPMGLRITAGGGYGFGQEYVGDIYLVMAAGTVGSTTVTWLELVPA